LPHRPSAARARSARRSARAVRGHSHFCSIEPMGPAGSSRPSTSRLDDVGVVDARLAADLENAPHATVPHGRDPRPMTPGRAAT
jgi:hypothetical protein